MESEHSGHKYKALTDSMHCTPSLWNIRSPLTSNYPSCKKVSYYPLGRSAHMSTTTLSKYASSHVKPQGPGDSRPTALQIVNDEQRGDSFTDKVVLITGCSSGLGVETARAMKATGATLFLTARNLDKARTALGDILDGGRVHLLKLDLESLDSVRACVDDFKAKSDKLNILIENAGIRNVPAGRTKDEIGRAHV